MVVSQRARKAEEECKQLQEQLATCEKERKAARSAAARAQGARSSIRTMAARTRQAEATAMELADRLETLVMVSAAELLIFLAVAAVMEHQAAQAKAVTLAALVALQ